MCSESKRDLLSYSRVSKKAVSGFTVGVHLFAHQSWTFGGSSPVPVWATSQNKYFRRNICSEINILPDISPARMGLLRISRVLQFPGSATTVNHVQVPTVKEVVPFIGRKRSGENFNKQKALGFSLAESLPGKERSFFFVFGSAGHRVSELPLWSPNSV